LPGNKLNLKAKVKSWQLIAAVVSGVALISGGVGVFAYQQYTQSQISTTAAAETAIELGQQSFEEISDLIDDLELAIRNSEETVINTDGQTLEEQEREDLVAEIEVSKEIWVAQKTKLLELEAAVKALKTNLASSTSSQEALALLTGKILDVANSNWAPITNQIVALGERIGSVQIAQEAWKKEQERIIAAETAARMAKAKTVPVVSTITDEGGTSAVTAPAAPPVNAPPKQGPTTEAFLASVAQSKEDGISLRSFIEAYIRALAPNTIFNWQNANLCDGAYVCGYAQVGLSAETLAERYASLGLPLPTLPEGFPVEQVVEINLDPRLEDIYVHPNGIGRYVLVHEAAHARQWMKYGREIINANQAYTSAVPVSRRWPQGVSGKDSVEYMADCMSISYLGYFVSGSYTTSCTPEQFAAADAVW